MAKVSVTNTAIIIHNYKMGDCKQLEWTFSNWDPIYHRRNLYGIYYDEENKDMYIPIGYSIEKVKYNLKISNNDVEYLPVVKYKQFSKRILLTKRPRDERQEEALRFMCGINEYKYTQDHPNLSVNLNTGVGKTYASIATITYFNVNSMIITGSTSLLEQWKNCIFDYTNIDESEVLFISGSDMINMIISGKSQKANNAKIFLCSHGTIHSYGNTFGWKNVSKLFEALHIGIKIIDEAHLNFQNTLLIDYFTNVVRTYYVTATPGRSSSEENKIFQISIGKVESIDLFDDNNDPRTDYIAIKFNSHPSKVVLNALKSKYGINIPKYVNWLTQTREFYKMVDIMIDFAYKNTISKGGKILIYIATNDGVLRLYKYICETMPQYIGLVGIFTSVVAKDEKRKELNKKIIISTMKSCSAGEDIPGLKMTIVMAEPFKSEILARQSLGRCRDRDTLYVEMVDVGFYHLNKFYNKKLPVFNKYALSTSEENYDSTEIQRLSDDIRMDQSTRRGFCPFKFRDDRFDFESLLPDWMKDEFAPESPRKVFKPRSNDNPYLKK